MVNCLMEIRFVPSESTFAYFEALKAYLRHHGKPVAFYSDKHSIFRAPNENAVSGNVMTQFGRALSELNIEILCANTSQAKGRVERAHHTLQDRLVKELRLAGISTIEAANAFLPSFVANYNGRFAKLPARDKDLHRLLDPRQDLDEVLCWREQRQVSHQLVVNYPNDDMKAPRSAAQAGKPTPSVFQALPAIPVSNSSSFVSAIRGRIRQDVLPGGLAQTVPAHRPSCHGTRTETCIVGNCLAPWIIGLSLPRKLF